MKKAGLTVVLMTALLSVPAGAGMRIGAINWDCSVPASTFFGGYQTRSLGPEKFRDRTPYYAKVLGRDRIDYPARTLAEYETEMRYAIEAGLDYFAYCWYDCTPVRGQHLVDGALATADEHTSELTQARRFHLQSELRRRLGLCAILVCCQPYSDTELKALAEAMKDPAYETVGGRPLVYLFEKPWRETLRRLCRFCEDAGVARPFVVVMSNWDMPPDDYSEVDAFSAYTCVSSQAQYEALAAESLSFNAARARHGKPIIPTWTVGWDPSPRIEKPVPWCTYDQGPYHRPATGGQLLAAAGGFADWIAANAAACVPGHVLTFAWNEFEEGGWICPTIRPDGKPDTTRLSDFAKAVKRIRRSWRESSLNFAPDEKEAVRRRIFSDSNAKSWWTDFSRACSSNLCLGADIPNRGGQWWNYYFCKRCNCLLRTEAADRHVCPKCRQVYSGWPYDDAALLLKHMKLSEAVRDAGLAYEISGDDQQFRFIKSVLLEYAAKYPKFELHDNRGKKSRSGGIVTSQALDDAVWLIGIVSGYDAVAGRLSQQERSLIEECVLRPEAAMLMKADAGSRHVGNHECWHAAAVGLVGYVLNDAELIRHAEKSSAGLDYQLKNGVLPDGAWFELAWGYHFYTIQALMPFYRAKRNHGGELPESLHKMFRAPISQVMSGWRLPANGDTGNVAFAPGAYGDLYAEAARWWPDDAELSAWASAVPKNSRGFALWGREREVAAMPQLRSTCSEGSGIAALRIGQLADGSPRTSLAFDFGPHGGWHGHLDKLSYELWHEGRCLADDPGCGNYAQPLHFAWIRQALAHNTISVDGRGQLPCEGKLLAFHEEGDRAAVVASAPIAEGVVATRALALMDGLVLDLVWTDSESEHAYDWAFHAKGDCSTSCDLAKTSLGEKIVRDRLQPENWDGSEAQTWLENLRRGAHGGAWSAFWSSASDTVRIRQASSPGEVYAGLGWGAGGRERETVVFNRVRGRRTVFATVVDFAAHDVGDIRFERTSGRIGMSVRIDGETRSLWFDETGRRVSFERDDRSVLDRLVEWFRSL